jgi:diguanylate cyclase (GGDEF)-like protein
MNVGDGKQLEAAIEALLADDAYQGHPLRQALAGLYAEFHEQLYRIERIARISDHYQSVAREASLSLTERYSKQLRQLEKIARISDRYQLMLRDLNESLKEASVTDTLTGIGNRHMLLERLKSEVARAERLQRPFTIAIADIDRFKTINDTHGHEAGDNVLVEIAQVLKSRMREYDTCGRWGGEEFLVIMPEITAVESASIVDRLRHAIEGLNVHIGDKKVDLSASFGIAQYRVGEPISDTLNRADAALYAAKGAGRNRYELAPEAARPKPD